MTWLFSFLAGLFLTQSLQAAQREAERLAGPSFFMHVLVTTIILGSLALGARGLLLRKEKQSSLPHQGKLLLQMAFLQGTLLAYFRAGIPSAALILGIFPFSILLGMLIPYLWRESKSAASFLLGAGFGMLLEAFFLHPRFSAELPVAAGVLISFALGGLSRFSFSLDKTPAATLPDLSKSPTLGWFSVFKVGAGAFLFASLCTSPVAMLLGGSNLSGTLVAGIFFAGLGIGAWIWPERWRHPKNFGRTLGLMLLVAVLARTAGTFFAEEFLETHDMFRPNFNLYSDRANLDFLGVCWIPLLAVFPVSLALGVAFSQAHSWLKGRDHASSPRPWALFSCVLWTGGLLGWLASNLFLVSTLGPRNSIGISLLLLFSAALWLGKEQWEGRNRIYWRLGVGAVCLIAFLFLLPSHGGSELLYSKDYGSGPVGVLEDQAGNRYLLSNHRAAGSSDKLATRAQVLLGQLPALIHPKPENALLLGLGTGIAAGSLAMNPEIKDLWVLEEQPGVPDALENFSEKNRLKDWPKGKARIEVRLANSLLQEDGKNFDLIINQPLLPPVDGYEIRHDRAFFQKARRRLAQGGIFATALPLHRIPMAGFFSVLRDFREEFPQNQIWLAGDHLLILGFSNPPSLSEESLVRRFSEEKQIQEFKQVSIPSPGELLSYYLGPIDNFLNSANPDETQNASSRSLWGKPIPAPHLGKAGQDHYMEIMFSLSESAPLLFPLSEPTSQERHFRLDKYRAGISSWLQGFRGVKKTNPELLESRKNFEEGFGF